MKQLTHYLIEMAVIAAIAYGMFMYGVGIGQERGIKHALNTNPVSLELELVCAGLWVGQQNSKYSLRNP